MSIRAINWCRDVGRRLKIPALERAVLMHICCYHNEKTGECFPSYDTIADDSGYRRRRVIEAVKLLEANGLITVQSRRVMGHQGSNGYVPFGKAVCGKWTPAQSAPVCTLPRVPPYAPDRDWLLKKKTQTSDAKLASGGRS